MTYSWDAPIKPKGTYCDKKSSGPCSYENCPQKPASYTLYLQKSKDCNHKGMDR